MSRKPAPRLPLGDPVKIRPTFARERAAMKRGLFPVAGCDEAGRGPLAGPVVAAAVILDPKRIPKGLNDSKKLNAETRAMLYEKICATAEVATWPSGFHHRASVQAGLVPAAGDCAIGVSRCFSRRPVQQTDQG